MPRILEIGHIPLVSLARPESTTFIDTTFTSLPGEGMVQRLKRALAQGVRIFRAVQGGDHEVLVCRCLGRYIYRRELSFAVNALRWLMGHFVSGCVRAGAKGKRLLVVDMLDEMTVDFRDLPLLDRCDYYFKRELPQNVWTTFQRVQPPHGEYADLSGNPQFVPLAAKLRPVSLGFLRDPENDPERFDFAPFARLEKRYDVFFAGAWRHSTVRVRGLKQLERLRSEGFEVLVLDRFVSIVEFWKLIAQSWLVWSPEGSGWECYRHYEIGLAGATPLINYPSIQRYQPLVEGVHCHYYAVEDDGLIQVAKCALADKPRLLTMAMAARQHVLAHHTNVKLGEYILRAAGV